MIRCSCEFTSSNIIDDTFSCRGSQGEFRNTVVYRAMITLQVPATITDADNIVVVLSEWVESAPSVRVNRVTLDVDSNCPTMLASFDSNDCETASDRNNPSSSSTVGIIVGAAVAAVVVILLLLITAVVIIIMYRRHNKSSNRYRACQLLQELGNGSSVNPRVNPAIEMAYYAYFLCYAVVLKNLAYVQYYACTRFVLNNLTVLLKYMFTCIKIFTENVDLLTTKYKSCR